MFSIGTVIGIVDPDSIDPGEEPIRIGAIVGLLGLISGLAFASVLAFTERHKKLIHLSLTRVAVWGMIGGAAFPLLTTMVDKLALITGGLGALFAAGTVAIARSAERREVGSGSRAQSLPHTAP